MEKRRIRSAGAVLRLCGKALSPRDIAVPPDGPGSVAPGVSASVRRWLLLLVACGVIGIVVLALYGKWQVGRIYASASYANTMTVPRIVALEDARVHFTRWRMALYRHALSEAPLRGDELDAAIARERVALRRVLDRYEAMSAGEDRQRLDVVRALMAQYERDAQAADDRLHAGQPELALRLLSTNANANDRIVAELDRQVAASVAQGRAEDAYALRTFTEAAWTTLVFVLMTVSALLAVGYVVGRRITAQVERIRMLAQDNEMFRLMLEGTSNQSVMLHDSGAGGRVIYANAAACRHFGVDRETILNWWPKDFDTHGDVSMSARMEADCALGCTCTYETEHRVASGELVPVEVTTNCFEHGGRTLGMAFVRDLRPQREAEARILEMQRLEAEHENARRLTRFAQSAPGFMYTVEQSPGGRAVMTYASPAVETIYGIGMADVLADIEHLYALIVPEDQAQVLRLTEESFRRHAPFHAEYRIRHSTRGLRWMEATSTPDVMEDGSVQWHGFVIDITEHKQMEEQLAAREGEFRTLVEHSPDIICRYDMNCRRTYANPKMIEDFLVPLEQLLGRTPTEFPGGEYALDYERRIGQVIASGEAANFELPWRNSEGRQLCSHVRLTPEFDREGGSVIGVLAVGRDITEIDDYRKRVHRMAFYDALTNLPNRALLNDRIGQTIADAAYHGHRFGLMLLDLDGFKQVNDTLGHGVGDQLLLTVGERLLGCVRIYDTVARLGGDEFAVLLPEVREDGNLAVVARKILEALAEPFHIDGKEIFVSASIGIAMYPADCADIDGLFRYADSAMYHAKKQGRNNFQFYSAELTVRSGERMAIESALRRARKNKELELYYQPQVDILSGRLVGAEALLRWNRGALGMVTPDQFIPIAEETGLIVGIGEWVLETACEAAVAWNKGRKAPLKVAVNLSTRQFVRNDLARSVRTILANSGCKPEWLNLEITESLLLDDAEDIRRTLAEFDAMGLSIAIDDFGTGYSALGYLNRFPVSVLKIDRSFVRDITTDRDRAELVKAIVSMARSLRMELVAEGVETDDQSAYLGNLGCHVAQGYLFGKPMPGMEFEALLVEMDAA